jgi:hypothetical protein
VKKLCVFLGVLLFLGVTFAASQPVPGKKFEFSTAIDFESVTVDGGSGSSGALVIPFRFGWFGWKGLEVEPEVQLLFPKRHGPSALRRPVVLLLIESGTHPVAVDAREEAAGENGCRHKEAST